MKKTFLTTLAFGLALSALSQEKVTPRFDYIMDEEVAQILVSPTLGAQTLFLNGRDVKFDYSLDRGMGLLSVSSSQMTDGSNEFVVVCAERRDTLSIKKLPPKDNAVQIDNLTGMIRTNDQDLIPCGYYAYSPVQEGLLEEELAQGMNLFSPYQHIENKTLKDRIAYLDRCSQLGIRVNYNMLNIAGGGGGSKASYKNQQERYAMLEAEIRAVKDHPAILGWYIADEPDGQGISAETLEDLYVRIKAIDPYHPVAIVILNAGPGRRYANSCDIMMCDPYPIPNSHPREVIDDIDGLFSELRYEKAIWCVPQTFGGNEWWVREPTPLEIRMMTWSAAAYGARGFQAFIRHGLSSFPKDPAMWTSYTKACREIQQLTSIFAGGERFEPRLVSSSDGVRAVGYSFEGENYVIAINTDRKNNTLKVGFLGEGSVYEYFENLEVSSLNGVIDDVLAPYQVKIYRQFNNADQLRAYLGARNLNLADNMIYDPSFEWGYSVASDRVASSYSGRDGDRGATVSLDSRVAYHGENSMHLTSPCSDGGRTVSLQFLQLKEGTTYNLSFWARTDQRTMALNPRGVKLFVDFCKMTTQTVTLTDQWQKYTITAHYDEAPAYIRGVTTNFCFLGAGEAWVDLVEVVPNMSVLSSKVEGTDQFEITVTNNVEGARLYYTLDGSEPSASSTSYDSPLSLSGIVTVRVCQVAQDGSVLGYGDSFVASHKAINAKVTLLQPFTKYTGGGAKALTDGVMAEADFRVAPWQGYIDNDMEAVIDLGEPTLVGSVSLSTYHSASDWIVPPVSVDFYTSEDGKTFTLVSTRELDEAKDQPSTKVLVTSDDIDATVRYIKVVAHKAPHMPSWHSEDAAWMFVDEIIVR